MKCKKCGEEMVVEDYDTTFFNNDEEICVCEYFGCVKCDSTAIKWTYYKKTDEEVAYNEMP